MASKDDYKVIEDIIKKLDIPRSMVYIEALIMEVNFDKDFDLGIEWQTAGQGDGFGATVGSGKGGTAPGFSPGNYPRGLTMGVIGDVITVSGVTFPSISAVINAYQKDKDVHILSTPQILTKDNEEAKIYVGKNVPFQTKSGSTSSSTDIYTSYEYRDVGITLKITPQISKDRFVSLKISQEISKIDEIATIITTAERPTTLKRTIDTTVVVEDKNTIVIGGLIDTISTETITKVPILGDLPLLGVLFRSKSRASEKTNMFVFLTPHILYEPEEAINILNEKRAHIESVTPESIKLYRQDNPEAKVKPAPTQPEGADEP